jgi:uncharacterized protein
MKRPMDLKSLESLKKAELVILARKYDIKNASGIRKDDLIRAIAQKCKSVQADTYTNKSVSKKKKSTSLSSPKKIKKSTSSLDSHQVQSPSVTGFEQKIHDAFDVPASVVGLCDDRKPQAQPAEDFSLPYSYNVTKLVAMIRDPYWVYTYWDIDYSMQQEIDKRFSLYGDQIRVILRQHDVTNIIFDGNNSHSQVDIDVDLPARTWYVYVGEPKRSFIFDLGIIDGEGNFFVIARSNIVQIPNDGPSDVVDDKWVAYDFEEIYLASGGYGVGLSSGELKKKKRALFDHGWASSGSVSSFSSQQPKSERDFFLEIGTEFILYGRTKPDATLTVDGEKIDLRPDGTFTLRYSLPDCHRTLPVHAVSVDKVDSRTITVDIKKGTK